MDEVKEELGSYAARGGGDGTEVVGMVRHEGVDLFVSRLSPRVVDPALALVICPSMFEVPTLLPTELELCRAAANAGWPSIYVHPPGSADSDGSFLEATPTVRLSVAVYAAELVRESYGPGTPLCFVGARWGAAIALAAATRTGSHCVLWDPHLESSGYWTQTLRLARMSSVLGNQSFDERPDKELATTGRTSVLGLPVTRSLLDEMSAFDPLDRSGAGSCFVVAVTGHSLDASRRALASAAHVVDGMSLGRMPVEHLGLKAAPEAVPPTLSWLTGVAKR